ncbi:MAG: hypothetical protein KJN64_05605 [Ignavibacteria bacterium]|nr:hypothetical protein [Ignavibacteria bacterium]MBT8382052.1 hypothetical protein [Ignavibacteria bacterium]MBT8392467.1 hypothetical protein [Ignavibacteria bacterium]NNJ52049.1 hypothetical protein [Ignavibacteriaceae bacterium]NNL19902.1 hypothetical protein [Ignavibacteriaceae bacterium]
MVYKTKKGKFFYLFCAITLYLIVSPFFEGENFKDVLMSLLFTSILFAGIYAISTNKKHLITAIILGGFAFLGIWYGAVVEPSGGFGLALVIVAVICQIAFIVYVITLILSNILLIKTVTSDTIYGAVSIYLLIGLAFTLFYLLIEFLQPGSFYINDVQNLNSQIDQFDIIYFSFTSLTTLGFGDITPVTSIARITSIIEAMLGVFYLAILIARFVGIFIAQTMELSSEKIKE